MGRGLLLVVVLLAAAAGPRAQTAPRSEMAGVLSRGAAWLQTLQKEFSVVVADETYHQQIGEAPSPAASKENVRDLQSEVAFLWVPGDGMWTTARNVQAADKERVNGSSNRLQRILAQPGSRAKLLHDLRAESAKFNLGRVNRTFNDPTFALQYLDPRWQNRFIWGQNGRERVNGVETWRLDFNELDQPFIIQVPTYTLQSTGRLWIDPATGVVHRTHLDVWDPQARVRTRIDVDLARDARLGFVVPVRMKEEYVTRSAIGPDVALPIHGTAEYTNFRRVTPRN